MSALLAEFLHNVSHNLFKPLLLFFYMGFLVPVLRVTFEFPYVIYQGLTLYLLIAIGWHGGEELASLPISSLREALGFMVVGFFTNLLIGLLAYQLLRRFTCLRRIDAATVAGYYGSDSAGTFVTCVGVLSTLGIAFEAYMPVMLAVMEIPGCLVALMIVSRLRKRGLDADGNAWDEPGYAKTAAAVEAQPRHGLRRATRVLAAAGNGTSRFENYQPGHDLDDEAGDVGRDGDFSSQDERPRRHSAEIRRQIELETEMALEKVENGQVTVRHHHHSDSGFSLELLHEVFLNPGIYLLFGGILIGFFSRLQGASVTAADDTLFVSLFQGILCLFLLEMGITASKRLRDLRNAGWRFILFGLAAPNLFAFIGIVVAHLYGMIIGVPFAMGTYVLFAVLCAAASYIAVPAVQRLAIPEASPTLPLAASLGLTFTYNVTVGIPLYILLAKFVTEQFPIAA